MPTTHVTKDQIESNILELKKKIQNDFELYLDADGVHEDLSYEGHPDASKLLELLLDIKDIKVSVHITYNTVDKKTEIIDELEGLVGEDNAPYAYEWCERNKEDLIAEGKKQIKEFGSDALDQMSCDISEYLDEYLFEDQGGFLSSVGFCGPSEDYDLRCCAGVWIQHNKDLIVKTNS